MAEAVISAAEGLLFHAIESAVYRIYRRRSGVRSQVQRLSSNIQTIRELLEDAEKRQVSDPAVKRWLESIKDVYYDVIDLMEELSFAELKISREQDKVCFLGIPPFLLYPFRRCIVNQDVGRKIRDMIDEIQVLVENKDELRLHQSSTQAQPSMVTAWHPSAIPTTSISGAHFYGRGDERRTLISKLLNEGGQDHQDIHYISIVGMGGMGKTSLAQQVYQSSELKNHFEFRAWVCVSEEFNLVRIAKEFAESVTSTKIANEVELESLFKSIYQAIEGKKYLLVLDDVWNEDIPKWIELQAVLNWGAPGSTILITTRNEAVARTAGSRPADIIKLGRLKDKDIWSIIRDLAIGTSIDGPDTNRIFNEVGKDIANKCRGSPLIAKCLGGILRGRTEIKAWQEVVESDVWELLPKHLSYLNYALMLSYYLLPPLLRQCLLYCAIFPKNHRIDVQKLIKLWMAQNFVPSDQDAMEKEGWRCVKDLLDRSIFGESEWDDNGNFICKLEGAFTDLIQFLAENECHIMLLDYKVEPRKNHVPTKVRHCTLNVAAQASLPSSIDHTEKLHTLMMLSEYSSTDPTVLDNLLSKMRRLRALDLSCCSMKELPLKVAELPHLRYLDLSFNRDLKKLPQAICNLFNLQTLNLDGCDELRKLPKGIGKLTKLRHLEILWTKSLSYLPKGIASLTSLRTLNRFFGSISEGSRSCNLGDLEELTNLQGCISIDGLGSETDVSQAEKASLKNKKDLRGLELWFSVVGSEGRDQDVLKALEAPPDLKCLGIFYYRGTLFPKWVTALEKLTHLKLFDCNKCKFLPPLGKLPSLASLEIKNMSRVKMVGPEFLRTGSDDAFPKLKMLHFQMLDAWEEWVGVTGERRHANIMPSLSSLSIVSCKKIRDVPDYIKRKKNLKTVIEECPCLKENPEEEDK